MKAPLTQMINAAANSKSLALTPLKNAKEFLSLLSKSRKESLSEAEQTRLNSYQQDMLKMIPLLILFMLPGSFLTLPLIFMVVPRDRFFPKSLME